MSVGHVYMMGTAYPIAPSPTQSWVQGGEATDNCRCMSTIRYENGVYAHMPSTLMHAEQVNYDGAPNTHAGAGAYSHEDPCGEDARPSGSHSTRALAGNAKRTDENEDWAPTVAIRQWRPKYGCNASKENGDGRVVGCDRDRDVHVLCQGHKGAIYHGLTKRPQECQEGDLDQDCELEPVWPVQWVYEIVSKGETRWFRL